MCSANCCEPVPEKIFAEDCMAEKCIPKEFFGAAKI
jgi:hypothetical protein